MLKEKYGIIQLLIIFTIFISGCEQSSPEEPIVASVFEKNLYWSQVYDIVPNAASEEDSIYMAKRFIDDWIAEQVVLHHAEQVLPESEKDFSAELENYRNSLLTYAFEKSLIRQKLDTLIDEAEIEAYYLENQQNFELKDYIVKAKFCKIASTISNEDEFSKLFRSEDTADLVLLESFFIDNGASYYIGEDWMYFSNLMQEIPLEEVYDTERFLKNNTFVKLQKDGTLYYLQIQDYKLKDSVSPLSFERENIKSIIANKRKIELLTKMRSDLLKGAIRKKKVETFYDQE